MPILFGECLRRCWQEAWHVDLCRRCLCLRAGSAHTHEGRRCWKRGGGVHELFDVNIKVKGSGKAVLGYDLSS